MNLPTFDIEKFENLLKQFDFDKDNRNTLGVSLLAVKMKEIIRYLEERETKEWAKERGVHIPQEPPKEKECTCKTLSPNIHFKDCPTVAKPELNVEEILNEYAEQEGLDNSYRNSGRTKTGKLVTDRQMEIINLIRANLR